MTERLHALVVTKNEAERYLEAALTDLRGLADTIFVYDDRSDDDTADLAAGFADVVEVRPERVASFLEHEGRFRQASWDAFEEAMGPEMGDWVIGIDADEFIVTDAEDRRAHLDALLRRADLRNRTALRFPRVEVWEADPDFRRLRIRVDGLWNRIQSTRIFRWQPGGVIQDKPMGCGLEPTYVSRGLYLDDRSVHMLHYGYVERADQREKYERYDSLLDHGHDDAHIQSIVGEPTLRDWEGPQPVVYRGRREVGS